MVVAEPGGVRVRARVSAREPGHLTLLAATVDAHGRTPSLRALASLEAHLRGAEARGLGDGGLRLETRVAELDLGTAWARALLEAAGGDAPPPPDPVAARDDDLDDDLDHQLDEGAEGLVTLLLEPAARDAWAALGALAAGDFALARELLPDPDEHPLAALARAQWVAWTGEPGGLTTARQGLDEALADWRSGGSPAWRALAMVAARRVAVAAEAVGDAAWARVLRGAPEPTRNAAVRRLPTLSGRADVGALAEAFLGGEIERVAGAPPPVAAARSPGAGLLLATAHYGVGRPDEGFPALAHALGAPVREGPPVSPLLPALALHALVSGLLGARPDAAFGRLRLAPALPSGWTRCSFRGLALGDATLDLDYERRGTRHHWRFTPTRGSVPPTLVLEPALAVAHIDSVEVDGRPAEVETFHRGSRVGVRLQLPLDAERSLTVDGS
jgi:hypothetical protein